MSPISRRRHRAVLSAVCSAAIIGTLAACSSAPDDGTVTISFLSSSDASVTAFDEAMIAAFEKENPDITVEREVAPADDQNYTQTQLSTGEAADVFTFNAGALLSTLNPDQTLVDLSDQSWVADLTDEFRQNVSTDNGTYGSPFGTTNGGGVLYNVEVYDELGLEIPTSWDEFLANSRKIKEAGIAPILYSFGDAWTSQLPVLADFANVAAQDPDWADEYTANEAKFADQPALTGFQHLAEPVAEGLVNEDYASMTFTQAIAALVAGDGAQYIFATSALSSIVQADPDAVDRIGVFALPADDAADTSITIWNHTAYYIPKTTEGAELEAAKKYLAFVNSAAGCAVQNEYFQPAGPYPTTACTLPDDVPLMVTQVEEYVEAGRSSLALEFLSPVKGPNLANITVAVGSGITSPEDGASQYDEDVKQQAQQLGLEGW